VAHVKALLGASYDGHTLVTVLPEIKARIGANSQRLVIDCGPHGHR
jgi:transposase, IS5 family